jgi:hypothetical protein
MILPPLGFVTFPWCCGCSGCGWRGQWSRWPLQDTSWLRQTIFWEGREYKGQSQWSHGLTWGSEATCLLGLQVQIVQAALMSLSCDCCVLSGRCLCIGSITHPEESYWMWCVRVWSWSLKHEQALAHQQLLPKEGGWGRPNTINTCRPVELQCTKCEQ